MDIHGIGAYPSYGRVKKPGEIAGQGCIVYRTLFGKLRLTSERFYHC
jgi:hypothetical protein